MTTKHTLKILRNALLTVWLINANTANANTDEMAERLRACSGCHDPIDAVASSQDYAPSITGKPVEYLYQQLLNYREGRRVNTVMNQMLAYLSREYLHEIATYYAQQEASRPVHEHDSKRQSPERTERARVLVQLNDAEQPACIACHGGDLRGNGIAIPSLRELSATYITAQLSAWQADSRHARQPDCMRDVAKSLSGSDITAVAHWIEAASESMLAPTPPQDPLPVTCGAVQ